MSDTGSQRIRVSYEYEIVSRSKHHHDRIIRELLRRPSYGSIGAGVDNQGNASGYRVYLIPDSGRVEPP